MIKVLRHLLDADIILLSSQTYIEAETRYSARPVSRQRTEFRHQPEPTKDVVAFPIVKEQQRFTQF
jgi:hypothetical protein